MYMFNLGKNIFLFLISICFTSILFAQSAYDNAPPFSFNEIKMIRRNLFNNIATHQHVFTKKDLNRIIISTPGAILASPSNHDPFFSQDYQFHWVRDAALTMNEVVYLYAHSSDRERKILKSYLMYYIEYEKQAQRYILGEPKYNLDGTVFEGDWARPQNDGPALRAITLMNILHELKNTEPQAWIRNIYYRMVVKDLDYIELHWHDFSYDLWEEVNDQDHFFTKMVQRKALIVGANWAKTFDDYTRYQVYKNIANQLSLSLMNHWDGNRGYYTETLKQLNYKGGGLNISILLGVLYGAVDSPNDAFSLNEDKILKTIYALRQAFALEYPINRNHLEQVPLMGRYPNDIYDGDQFILGNPWILTTAALAQYYYALAQLFLKQGYVVVDKDNLLFFQQIDPAITYIGMIKDKQFHRIIHQLILQGDTLLMRIKSLGLCYAKDDCYHYAEQIDRTTGKQTSAKDLTWGYVAILQAMQYRTQRIAVT